MFDVLVTRGVPRLAPSWGKAFVPGTCYTSRVVVGPRCLGRSRFLGLHAPFSFTSFLLTYATLAGRGGLATDEINPDKRGHRMRRNACLSYVRATHRFN